MTSAAAAEPRHARRAGCAFAHALGFGLLITTGLGPPDAIASGWRPSQYRHQVYDRSQGLPSDIVWSVLQDRVGYLWLGTQNGLVRYDGVRFTVFSDRTHPEFTANDVRVVADAPDGSIWAGTYGGGVVHMKDSGPVAYTSADGLAADIVYDIHFPGDGSVWFATAGGVTRMREGEFRTWTAEDGLAANRVFKISADDAGHVWFATLTGGLSRYDGTTFTNYGERDGLDSLQVHLLYDDDGDLLTGTYAGGLYRVERGQLQPVARGSLPPDLSMHSILRDRSGQVWLGTYGSGLWRWGIGGPADRFRLTESDPSHVFDLFEDREDNLWLATMNGLHRLRTGAFQPWGTPEGLADSTFVVTEGPATGTIWTGSEGQGVFGLAPDGSVTRLDRDDGLASNSVSSLLFDSRNRFWIGTFGGGVQVMTDGELRPLESDPPLPGRQIFALMEASDGAIWIATEGGLARWEDGSVQTFTAADGLPGPLVRNLMQDRDGAIWMSTPEGLARYDGTGFRTWSEADGLASNIVSTTHQDEDGAIWIGMRNGGLARLDHGKVFQFGAEHGLEQSSVLEIIPDDAGNFWLSGLAGLVRVNRGELDAVAESGAGRVRARLFDETDGLRSSRFMVGFQPAGVRARDGRIWFPTNRGLVAFDPESVPPARSPDELIIERVRIDSESVSAAAPIVLPAATQSLEIEYTVPRLHAPNRLQFRYRLGDDGPWQEAGSRRTAYFTNLPPGRHRFEVQAASTLIGFGSPETVSTAALEIKREPYWYQTWWFQALAVIALALAGWGVYRGAMYRTRLRQRHLKALVHQRTRELRRALTKVERISRIDGLTGVANRRYFDERLRQAWGEAARHGRPISALMVDIDRFKEYNDSQGHLAGDECLKTVSATLESGATRDGDLVARYGGEEFIVLLADTDRADAGRVAERIRRHIEHLDIQHPACDTAERITVSIGAATVVPESDSDPELIIRRADAALYEAKRAGRNCVVADG